jgi:hypothetical protein
MKNIAEIQIDAFKKVKLELADKNIKQIRGYCPAEGTNSDCFPGGKEYPMLKAIRSLKLVDMKKLTDLGDEDSNFFALMPNLKLLDFRMNSKYPVNVFLSNTTTSLISLTMVVSNTIFKCQNKVCFPPSIKKMELFYPNSIHQFVLNTTNQLKNIEDMVVNFIRGESSNESNESVKDKSYRDFLNGRNIKKLAFYYDHDVGVNNYVSLTDVKVSQRFYLKNDCINKHNKMQLSEIYNNPHLKKMLLFVDNSDEFPVIIGGLQNHIKKGFLENCHLSKRVLLETSNVTTTDNNGRKKLIIRAYNIYDLSDIYTKKLFDKYDEIEVTAYQAFISKSFSVTKTLRVNYFSIGGIPEGPSIYDAPIKRDGVGSFRIKDFNVKAMPFKFSTLSDPVFTRALAMCVSQNIGALAKRKAGSTAIVDLQSKDFWLVSQSFPKNITFGTAYSVEEKALAWEALSNMNRYLRMLIRQSNRMKEMSDVVLRRIEEGDHIFSTYGKKLSSKWKLNFDESNSRDQIKKKTINFQWFSLDHVYQKISLYKNRFGHALEAHLNGRPLLYQLVLMFNKHKKEVDSNAKTLEIITKRSNSFRSTRTITIIVQSIASLLEDKKVFERILQETASDWKPEKTRKVIERLKEIRKLVLALDSFSVAFADLNPKMENKETKYIQYVHKVSELLHRLVAKSKIKTIERKLRDIIKRLDAIKDELLWPDQIVKSAIYIQKAIEIGRDLPGEKEKAIFEKIPEPMGYFNPKEVYQLHQMAMNISIDTCLEWGEVVDWMSAVLNSTNVNMMFQQLKVRYPLLDLVTTAREITEEMISNYGYQINAIEAYLMYLVYYQKAIALRESNKELEGNHLSNSRTLHPPVKPNIETPTGSISNDLRKLQTSIDSEALSLKMELLDKMTLHCNAYFYKTSKPCPMDFSRTNLVDSLDDVLDSHSALSAFSNRNNDDTDKFKSGDSIFNNYEIVYEIPPYCKFCFDDNQHSNKTSDFGSHDYNDADDDSVMMKNFACSQQAILKNENRETKDLNDLQNIANQCFNNKVQQLHKFNAFSFRINVGDVVGTGIGHVILHKIDVILQGARTETRLLKLYIASTGVYQQQTNKGIYTTFEDTSLYDLVYDIIDINHAAPLNQRFGNGEMRPSPGIRKGVLSTYVNKAKSNASTLEDEIKELSESILTSGDEEIDRENSSGEYSKPSNLQNISDESILANGENNGEYNTESYINSEHYQDVNDVDYLNYDILPKYKIRLNRSPFGTWMVIVPRDKNPGLDVRMINKITIKLSGTFQSIIRKDILVL